jgi:histidinol-phosphate aminotransferase
MSIVSEKGGATFQGIKMLLCENPLPPIDEAIVAAQAEVPHGNYYTEPYSAPLRQLIATQLPEIAQAFTETRLQSETGFAFDLDQLEIPKGTTLAVIVNPNNPNGGSFDMAPLPALLKRHPETFFLVDEAFIGMAGESVASQVPQHSNLIVSRTLSKAHSLAGFRVGYAILPVALADDLNSHNDAYPLARASQAAALATLRNEDKIHARATTLRTWATELAHELEQLGVKTFPSQTYFFLADFAPRDASVIAEGLKARGILIKPLNDPLLGPGYMRVTTALPEDNARFIVALRELLAD